jgi:hypothetical protein
MSELDLFGTTIVAPPKTKVKGYAARPGSGPAGETCRTCSHYAHKGTGNRSYPACGLMRAVWTSGPGTDIKAKSPACVLWKK